MTDDAVDYQLLDRQVAALLADEDDALANSANFVGLLWQALPRINWLGIYVLRGTELVLGPFQGNPACVRIPLGSGVCGTAAERRQSLRVADVDEFPGHIVCDAASRSELVVPIESRGTLLGVLDIDSPVRGRFSAADQAGVERAVATFAAVLGRDGSTPPRFI